MIPIADLKKMLRVTNDAEDDLILELEKAAVEFAQERRGEYYGEPEETAQYFSPYFGQQYIYLSQTPAADPAPVIESFDGSSWSPVASTDYQIAGATLFNRTGWSPGERNIRVTYTRGYTAGQEPPKVRHAVRMLVAHWYEYRVPIVTGMSVEDVPLSVDELLGKRIRV